MFLYTISCMQGGHTTLTLIFIIFYMTAALLQVWQKQGTARGPHGIRTPGLDLVPCHLFSGRDSGG